MSLVLGSDCWNLFVWPDIFDQICGYIFAIAVTCSISMFLWRPSHPSLFDYRSVDRRANMGIMHSWELFEMEVSVIQYESTSEFSTAATALHLTLVCPYKSLSMCSFQKSYLSCTWCLVILAVGCNGLVHWQREGMAWRSAKVLFMSYGPMDVSDSSSKIQNLRAGMNCWIFLWPDRVFQTHEFCGHAKTSESDVKYIPPKKTRVVKTVLSLILAWRFMHLLDFFKGRVHCQQEQIIFINQSS